MSRPIFHLAFPVPSLAAAKRFYVDQLGASVGRENPSWIDIWFYGHQLTIHEKPNQVLPQEILGVRHFGIVMDWQAWESLADRLGKNQVDFLSPPQKKHQGTPQEQAKFHLRDPGQNVLEFKAYRNPQTALGTQSSAPDG